MYFAQEIIVFIKNIENNIDESTGLKCKKFQEITHPHNSLIYFTLFIDILKCMYLYTICFAHV